MQKEMKEVKCPRCGSEDVDFIDCNHHDLDWEGMCGNEDGIYSCPKCRIQFGVWVKFKVEVEKVTVDWIEEWEED